MFTFHSCSKEKIKESKSRDLTKEQILLNQSGSISTTEGDYLSDSNTISEEDNFDYSNCDFIKNSISKGNGMLVFNDMVHFEECVICLEKDFEDYNDAYESQYPDATAEELNVLDSINNFNRWVPYEQFEESLGFQSLRARIEGELQYRIETAFDGLDLEDPELNMPIINEAVRTLLNEDGAVVIGGVIIEFLDDIIDVEGPIFVDACAFSEKTTQEFFPGDHPSITSDRKLRVSIVVRSRLTSSKLEAKITWFKRLFGDVYIPDRATMRIGVIGAQFSNNCDLTEDLWYKFNTYKKRHSRWVTSREWVKWREALADEDSDLWGQENSIAHAYFRDDNNYFPVVLIRN